MLTKIKFNILSPHCCIIHIQIGAFQARTIVSYLTNVSKYALSFNNNNEQQQQMVTW